jgi:hypothetical protein
MTNDMTILDYMLLGGAAAVAIYVIGRLFLGWRNSANRPDGEIRDTAGKRIGESCAALPERRGNPDVPHDRGAQFASHVFTDSKKLSD